MRAAKSILCAGAALSIVLASPSWAQESASATEAAEAAPSGEIVVTARKRSETASTVPDSLVVLGSDMIVNMSIKQAGDLGRTLPNIGFKQDLSVTSSFISVRGITSTRNTDPALSLVIDGVQAASASQIRQQLFDIDQMEVLKGPQGALYGRNAIAGAINVVTKKPTNIVEGRGEFGFGNAGSMEGSVSLSGPIIEDVLLFRVSGFFHDDKGSIRNTALDENVDFKTNKTGRVRLLFTPTPDLELDFKYNHDDYKGGSYYYVITRAVGDPFPTANPRSNSNSFGNSPVSVPISVNYATIDDASLNMSYDMGFATISSITAWSRTKERYGVPGEGIGSGGPGDLDFLPPEFIGNSQSYNVKAWSEEVRLTSNANGPFRWQVGAFYTNIKRRDTLPVYIPDGVNPLEDTAILLFPNGTRRKIDAYAFFGQLEYDILDTLTATFGMRYDKEKRSQVDLDDPTAPKRRATFDLPTPKFSLAWKPVRGQMVYATVARGFRSGGFNAPRTIFDEVYKQEEVWSYELGYKGSFMNGRARVVAAVFHQDIKNKQDFLFDSTVAAQSVYTIPKSWVRGVELELNLEPIDDLKISAAGGIMDSKVQEYEVGPLFPQPVTNASIIGNKLSNFSHWTASVAVDYTASLTADWNAKLHVDYSVRGKNYWDVTNIDREKNVGLLAANIGIENERWGVSLWGTNLTNTKYWSAWYNQQVTGLPDIGNPAEPRRYGARVKIKL
ncbi:MAG: TonB-dependent receptor [Sphingobium sp.]|uniref:TonB-dependent receptor n=1 Tax=Sphingobium sp. TaxID=1912891 RepID=UPI003BAE258A